VKIKNGRMRSLLAALCRMMHVQAQIWYKEQNYTLLKQFLYQPLRLYMDYTTIMTRQHIQHTAKTSIYIFPKLHDENTVAKSNIPPSY
jgi:hypothetical protein